MQSVSSNSGVDAILVLGGGVREGGLLPEWVKGRFDLALKMRRGEPILCLSAGTVHKPCVLDNAGFPFLESVAGAEYLFRNGVQPSDVLVELSSWDTVGNAYFSRLLFADPLEWQSLLVITSEFHMRRTRALFEWVYSIQPRRCTLEFAASADSGLTGDELRERRTSEERSLAAFQASPNSRIGSLRELTIWLNGGHAAYASNRRERLAKTSVGSFKSY